MEPTIHVGESVRIVPRSSVRRGDIVVADICGALAVHRALSVRRGVVVCCGDNLRRRDPAIPLEAVYGVAVAIEGGRRFRGGSVGAFIARSRFWANFLVLAGRAFSADLRLLRRQMAGEEVIEMWGLRWPPTRHDVAVQLYPEMAARLIAGADARTVASNDDVPAVGVTVEIPLGVFCGLRIEERRRLLGALAGSRVYVWAAPARGIRVHLTDALRSVLLRAGRSAGELGDGAVRARDGSWRLVHHFTPLSLEKELVGAGARDVQVGVATVISGPLLRASAQL